MNLNFLKQGRGAVADYNRGIGRLLLLLAFLPLFFLPWTTNVLEYSKYLFLMLIVAVALVMWLLSTATSNRFVLRLTIVDKGVLAILAALIIATIFSLVKEVSGFGSSGGLSSSLLSGVALTLYYFLLTNSNADKTRFRDTLGLVLGLVFLFGLLQFFTVYIFNFSFANSRAFNTVGSINGLGLVAAISLPFLLQGGSSRVWRLIHYVAVILALAILVIINWWVLWVAAIIGMLALIAFGSINQKRFSIENFLLPMLIVVAAVFLMITNYNIKSVKQNFPVEVAPSYSLSWQVSKATLKDKFLTGYGPENFSLAFDRHGAKNLSDSTLSSARFFDATSEFFNLLTTGGVIALAGFVILIWAVWQALRQFVGSGDSYNEGLWASLVASVLALFLYPYSLSHMFLLYSFLALGALTLNKGTKEFNLGQRPSLSMASSLGFVAGLVLALVGVYFAATTYIASAKYSQVLAEADTQKAAQGITSVISWDDGNDEYYRGASQVALRLLSQELNKKADPKDTQRTERIQKYLSSSVELAKQAVVINDKNPANWDNLGDVYQAIFGFVDGVDREAETAYLKASEARPGDPLYFNKIGSLYLGKADALFQIASAQSQNAPQLRQQAGEALGKSEANFKKAIEASPNYGLAIYNLGVVYERQGRVREAVRQLERIAPYNAEKANLMFELGLLYYRDGQKEKATKALERAVVIAPQYANALWYLGLLYEEQGNRQAAISQMKKILAVEVNKNNEIVLAKLKQLQSGSAAPTRAIDQKPL